MGTILDIQKKKNLRIQDTPQSYNTRSESKLYDLIVVNPDVQFQIFCIWRGALNERLKEHHGHHNVKGTLHEP